MKLQPAAQHPAPLAAKSAVAAAAPFASSPSAAASAILKAALSLAQHHAPKTDLSVPFAPLKVHSSPISSSSSEHENNLSVPNAALCRLSMPLASTPTRSPSPSPTPQSATSLPTRQHQRFVLSVRQCAGLTRNSRRTQRMWLWQQHQPLNKRNQVVIESRGATLKKPSTEPLRLRIRWSR